MSMKPHPLAALERMNLEDARAAAADAAQAAEDETTDPRGDDACPECPEGTLVHTGRRHPAATQVECDVCGYSA